jgi:hypothetical protein
MCIDYLPLSLPHTHTCPLTHPPAHTHTLSHSHTHPVIDLVTDAMTCAGERDIYTGDSLDIWIITEAGTQMRNVPLKRD